LKKCENTTNDYNPINPRCCGVFYLIRHDGGIGGDVHASNEKGEMMFDEGFMKYFPGSKLVDIGKWINEYVVAEFPTPFQCIEFNWVKYKEHFLPAYKMRVTFHPRSDLPDSMQFVADFIASPLKCESHYVDGIRVLSDPRESAKHMRISPIWIARHLSKAVSERGKQISELAGLTVNASPAELASSKTPVDCA